MKQRLKNCILFMLFALLSWQSVSAQQRSSLTRGTEAPEIVAKDTLGVEHRLSSLRGMWVVVDFWASWCGDCRREIPELKKVYQDYGCCYACQNGKEAKGCKCHTAEDAICGCASTGIAFLSLSMDTDAKAWKNCLRKEQFPWLQLSNLEPWKESKITKAYDVHWLPTMFLIDPNGKIVCDVLTAKELREKLAEMREMIQLRDSK